MKQLQADLHLLVAAIAGVLLLIALPGLHWVLTLPALLGVAVLAYLQPAWVVALVVASIPLQSEFLLPFVPGEFTVTQVLMIGLTAGWGVVIWKRRLWLDSVVIGFLCVMAAYVISFIAVDSPGLWFQETYRWGIAGVLYVIARSVLIRWSDVILCLWAIVAGVIAVSLHASWQELFGVGPDHFQVGGATRVYSTFGTPNTLAAYLEFTLPVLIVVVVAARLFASGLLVPMALQIASVIAIAAGGVTLLLTQSRGGYLGMAAAMVVVWLWLPGRWRLVSVGTVAVVLLAFSLTGPGQSQLSRFTTLMEDEPQDISYSVGGDAQTAAGRSFLWGAARGMLRDHPWTGVGAGEFDEHFREYTTSWFNRFPRGQAHNVWLQMGAQAGIPGIVAYAVWLAASVWSLITARRRASSPMAVALATGVIAVFAAYCVHSMVDYLNVLSLSLQLSVLTALVLNLAPEPLTRYRSSDAPVPTGTLLVPAT